MPDTNSPQNPAAGLTLTNTTVVPTGNPQPVFDDNTSIKMVVLGNIPNVVQNADDMSLSNEGVARKVVWFVNGLPANYQHQFNVPNLPNAQAFSLKTDNTVADVIPASETADDVRIQMAFEQAAV